MEENCRPLPEKFWGPGRENGGEGGGKRVVRTVKMTDTEKKEEKSGPDGPLFWSKMNFYHTLPAGGGLPGGDAGGMGVAGEEDGKPVS